MKKAESDSSTEISSTLFFKIHCPFFIGGLIVFLGYAIFGSKGVNIVLATAALFWLLTGYLIIQAKEYPRTITSSIKGVPAILIGVILWIISLSILFIILTDVS